jgi:hypothetical protein
LEQNQPEEMAFGSLADYPAQVIKSSNRFR